MQLLCWRSSPQKKTLQGLDSHHASDPFFPLSTVCCAAGGGGALVAKSCPTLATPWTVARQAPLSMGFSRQEYCSGLPFPSPYCSRLQSQNTLHHHYHYHQEFVQYPLCTWPTSLIPVELTDWNWNKWSYKTWSTNLVLLLFFKLTFCSTVTLLSSQPSWLLLSSWQLITHTCDITNTWVREKSKRVCISIFSMDHAWKMKFEAQRNVMSSLNWMNQSQRRIRPRT